MAYARALEGLAADGPSLFLQSLRALVFSAHSYSPYYNRSGPKMSMEKSRLILWRTLLGKDLHQKSKFRGWRCNRRADRLVFLIEGGEQKDAGFENFMGVF
ncbi:MAG: hypothetical protein HFK04_02295 [Oscillospiraceae bacterium]|nr:hypothetical protein [Oscillospiraceae bacterium]